MSGSLQNVFVEIPGHCTCVNTPIWRTGTYCKYFYRLSSAKAQSELSTLGGGRAKLYLLVIRAILVLNTLLA